MRPFALVFAALFLATSAFAAVDVYPHINSAGSRAVSGQEFTTWIFVSSCCGGWEQVQGGRLTVELPPELGLNPGPEGESCVRNGNVLDCALPPLWSGNAITLNLRGTPRVETTRTVTITATVTLPTPDTNASNNTERRDVLVLAQPDVSVFATQQFEEYDPATHVVFDGDAANVRLFIANLGMEARDLHLRIVPHNTEIEAILPGGWDCSASGPDSADCVRSTLRNGWGGDVLVRLKTLGRGAVRARLDVELTTASADYTPGNDRSSAEFDVFRSIVVDTVADSGAGSLRHAIETANAECPNVPCRIRFALPPRADWYTIEPRTPLPAITANGLILDARTQSGWISLNPRIALDGHLLESGDGLVLSSPCAVSVIGFAIGNFPGNGISIDSPQLCQGGRKRIAENRIGSDPTGEWPWPNTRGIVASGKGIAIDANVVGGNRRSGIVVAGEGIGVSRNIIGGLLPNGASGVYVAPGAVTVGITQNVIADNLDMGVAVTREARDVQVRYNSLRRNGGLGIDVGLDGRTSATPAILGVRRAGHELFVTVSVREDAPFYLDIYANDSPDGEGEQLIHPAYLGPSDGTPIEIRIGGSYSGKWINATSTKVRGTTSEVGDAVFLP